MKEPLLTLKASELRDLAGALDAGRLGPPYTALSLQRFVSRERADAIATSLAEIGGRGSTPVATARFLTLLATAAEERPLLEDVVDLVATGPDEVEGEPRDTGVVVSNLFREAQSSVLVAGYSVYQGQKVFRDLADRMAEYPQLQVRLYLDIQRRNGDSSLPLELERRFSERFRSTQWPPHRPIPEVYYDPRSLSLDRGHVAALHAKCVIVDSQRLFVSSANFTEAAQERNIEIGLLLESPILATRLSTLFHRLTQRSILKRAL